MEFYMKKITYLCLVSIITLLFNNLCVFSQETVISNDAQMLAALGICSEDIQSKETVSRGEFSKYLLNIYNGGKKSVSDEEAVSFAVDNGYINNASSGNFEADMAIRNDVAAKAVVDFLGHSYKVQDAADYWVVAGSLELVYGMNRYDLLTGENCVKLLIGLLEADAHVFKGMDGEDFVFEKTEALDAYYDLSLIKGQVVAVENRSLINQNTVGVNCVKINNRIYEYQYDMTEFLGLNVKAYVRDEDGMVLYASDNSREKITVTDNEVNRDMSTLSSVVIDHEDGKTEKYSLSPDVDVVINGDGYFAYTVDDLCPDYGSLTLIDNDGDGSYDVVKVKSYDTIAVNYIENTEQIITGFYGKESPSLADLDGISVTKNGKSAFFTEILQDDVVGVAIDKAGNYAEVIISSEKLYGTVKSISDTEMTIDDKVYELAPYYQKLSSEVRPKVNVGDSITATLDTYGRIAHISKSGNGVLKYGYLIHAYTTDYGDSGAKIFTADNTMELYKINDKAKIDGSTRVSEDAIKNAFYENGKFAPQLVIYSVNAEKEVTRIYTDNSDKLSRDFDFAKRAASGTRILSSSGDDFVVDSSTIMFVVPDTSIESTDEDYIIGTSPLVTGYDYTQVAAYDVNDFGLAKVTVSRTTAKLDSTLSNDDYQDTAYCVVDRIIEYATEDGEIIKQLHGFNTSKEVVFNVRSNKYSLLEGLKKGDVVMVKNDFITDYVSDIDFIGNKDSEYKRSTRKVSSSGIPYYESIRGVVTNKFGATLKISTLISDAEVEKIYPASGGTVFIIEDGKIRYGNIGEVQIEDEILLRSRASAVKEVVIFR